MVGGGNCGGDFEEMISLTTFSCLCGAVDLDLIDWHMEMNGLMDGWIDGWINRRMDVERRMQLNCWVLNVECMAELC